MTAVELQYFIIKRKSVVREGDIGRARGEIPELMELYNKKLKMKNQHPSELVSCPASLT